MSRFFLLSAIECAGAFGQRIDCATRLLRFSPGAEHIRARAALQESRDVKIAVIESHHPPPLGRYRDDPLERVVCFQPPPPARTDRDDPPAGHEAAYHPQHATPTDPAVING